MTFPRISLFAIAFAAAALGLSSGALAQAAKGQDAKAGQGAKGGQEAAKAGQDAAKLAQEKACLACHAVDKKVVGPSYKDMAAKYKSDKNAEANLMKKVRAGSVGVWGQVPMPPNTTVSEKEAQILVKWILSQK